MSVILNVSIGDDHVASFRSPDSSGEIGQVFKALGKAESVDVIDVSDLPVIPGYGFTWDGAEFSAPESYVASGYANPRQSGMCHFAFVVDGLCLHSQAVGVDDSAELIAAYKSNPTFTLLEE
jgi:hypothetical protein